MANKKTSTTVVEENETNLNWNDLDNYLTFNNDGEAVRKFSTEWDIDSYELQMMP